MPTASPPRFVPADPRAVAAATLLVLSSLAAGCIPATAPPPAPAPTPVAVALPPPRPLASDWRDWPRTPGDWRYAAGISRFAGSDGRPLLTLSCDRAARRLILTRPSSAVATALTIRTTSTVRALPVQARAPADAAPLVMLDATLPTDDRVLDAMAFTRGTFTVEQPGQPPLVVPGWAEIGRVIEDCR